MTITQRRRATVRARDPDEAHRTSTPLELLFDLCFVVAIASTGTGLHHALTTGHVGHGLLSYATVFFAVWWGWMNFTWFASAFDADDVPHRLLTLIEIAGVLMLAAGVPRAFDHADFAIVTLGYLVMRSAMTAQWLRVAAGCPERRRTALRYAAGLGALEVAWLVRLLLPSTAGLLVFALLVIAEVALPVWAERAGGTTWHPGHIAERYGLFTLLVLGEGVLGATVTVQAAITEEGASAGLLGVAVAGLALIFGLWWVYFGQPAEIGLRIAPHASFRWGYAHLVLFAALAAVGVGIQVVAEAATHRGALGVAGAGFALAVPVAAALVTIGVLQSWLDPHRSYLARFGATAALVLGCAATAWLGFPPAAMALLMAAAVTGSVVVGERSTTGSGGAAPGTREGGEAAGRCPRPWPV